MGHTVWSQRIVMDVMLGELSAYGKSLREDEKRIYDEMLKTALQHIGNVSYTSSVNAWALVLLSIMLEQEKRIRKVEQKIYL